MKSIGLREVGAVVIIVALVITFLLLSFIDTLTKLSQESCTCGDICGMTEFQTPLIVYAGLVGVCIIFVVGVNLFVKGGTLSGQADHKSIWKEKLTTLRDDEKTLYRLIMEADGTVFQSDLVEKTGLSKVKVTRTLDKLESRRLLERRRRGLTNIIVLK